MLLSVNNFHESGNHIVSGKSKDQISSYGVFDARNHHGDYPFASFPKGSHAVRYGLLHEVVLYLAWKKRLRFHCLSIRQDGNGISFPVCCLIHTGCFISIQHFNFLV